MGDRPRRYGTCEFCGTPNRVLMEVDPMFGATWRCSTCRVALWRAECRAVEASRRLVAVIDKELPADPELAEHMQSPKAAGLRKLRAHVKALEAVEEAEGTEG